MGFWEGSTTPEINGVDLEKEIKSKLRIYKIIFNFIIEIDKSLNKIKMKLIGTHDGNFHLDEVMACALLL